jgi:hypothetical protein
MKSNGIKSTPTQCKPETTAVEATPSPSGVAEELESKPQRELSTATAIIEIPLGEVADQEYLSRHVESRLKTREQQLAMKRLLRGLQASGATTQDGRPVQRTGDVIRWMMEQVTTGAVG